MFMYVSLYINLSCEMSWNDICSNTSFWEEATLVWSKSFGYIVSIRFTSFTYIQLVPYIILDQYTISIGWQLDVEAIVEPLHYCEYHDHFMGFVVSLCFNASKPFSGQNHWGHWDGVVDVHEMPRPRLCYQHKENMRTCFCNLFDLQPGKGRGDWASMIHTHDTCNYLW